MNESYKSKIRKLYKSHTCGQAAKVLCISPARTRDMAFHMGLKFKSAAAVVRERKETINALLRDGVRIEQIAEKIKLTIKSAKMFCYKHSIQLPLKRARNTCLLAKRDEIVSLVNGGFNTREIADKMGIKINSVRKFCDRNKLDVTPYPRTTFAGTRYVRPKNVTSTKAAIDIHPNLVELVMIKIRKAGYVPVYAENVTSKDGKGIVDTGRFIIGMKGGKKNILSDYNAVLEFAEGL